MIARIGCTVVFLFVGLSSLSPPVSAAGFLRGRLGVTGSVYQDTTLERQSELYTNFFFDLRDDSGIAFNLSGRNRAFLTTDTKSDWRLYATNLSWTSRDRRWSAAAGRQFMSLGVLRGYQDGVTLTARRLHRPTDLGFAVFVGQEATVRLDAESGDLSTVVLGLMARARFVTHLTVQLTSSIDLEDSATQSDLIGLLVAWSGAGAFGLDGNLDYDLTLERADRAYARAIYAASSLTCTAEYRHQEAVWLPESSWYYRFRDLLEPLTQYRLGLELRPSAVNWLSAGAFYIYRDGDEHSVDAYLGGWGRLRLGYRLTGDDDFARGGAYATLHQGLTNAVWLDMGVDFSRYTVYDLYDLPSYGSYLRASVDPGASFHLFGEVQYIKDRVMDQDVRLLIGANYRFRNAYGRGSSAGGVQ